MGAASVPRRSTKSMAAVDDDDAQDELVEMTENDSEAEEDNEALQVDDATLVETGFKQLDITRVRKKLNAMPVEPKPRL